MDSELSEDFEVIVGMHQGSVPSPFLISLILDVVAGIARDGELSELLYADDFVQMNETIEGLSDKKIMIMGRLTEKRFKS